MNQAFAEYLKLAQKNINQKQWQEAKINFQKAIQIQPNRWDIYYNLGIISLKQQQYKKAVDNFQQSILLQPNYANAHNNLGKAFLKLNLVDNAVQSFIKAINIDKNNPHFYFDLGEGLIQKQLIAQALECFRQSVKLKPKNYELQFQLGNAFRNQGSLQEALNCFCRSIQLNPNYSPAYISLKYIDLEPEWRTCLIDFYRQILKANPQLPDALSNLAEILTSQDTLAEAITISRQAIYLKTTNENPDLPYFNWQTEKNQAPDFIIIGVGKCGTTSLYNYLGYHPQILLPNKKELRFFDKNFAYGYEWYLAQFPAITDSLDLLTGEASPAYFFSPNVPQRLKNFAPHVKLIVMLRNPVERSISSYYQQKKTGRNHKTLEEAIKEEIQRLEQQTETELSYQGSLLSQSLYYYKLKRWMKIFPKQQFLILKSEDFFSNTNQSMQEVFAFLDLPNIQNHSYQKHNVGNYPPVADNIKNQLGDFFAAHNQRLEEFLQKDFYW